VLGVAAAAAFARHRLADEDRGVGEVRVDPVVQVHVAGLLGVHRCAEDPAVLADSDGHQNSSTLQVMT
jgi:hypothetical protein